MENTSIKLNISAFTHMATSMKGKAGNSVEDIFYSHRKERDI